MPVVSCWPNPSMQRCARARDSFAYGSSLTHFTILSLTQIAFIPGHCQALTAAFLKDAAALSSPVPDSALQPAKTKQAARIARQLSMKPRARARLRFLLRLDGKCSSWIGGLVISLCLFLIGVNSNAFIAHLEAYRSLVDGCSAGSQTRG